MDDTTVETITDKDNPVEELTTEEQKANFFLRSRYLKMLSHLTGSACEIMTVEKNKMSGIFKGLNIQSSKFCVENLQTPIGVIPHAVVRGSDIINMEIALNENQFRHSPLKEKLDE